MVDDRLIQETGAAAGLALLVAPTLEGLGFDLVRVRLFELGGATLQIMIEKSGGGAVTVEDCGRASRALSPILEAEDAIESAYRLELSSPGIDRPLVRERDFRRWVGHAIRIEVSASGEGQKRFKGFLEGLSADGVTLAKGAEEAAERVVIPLTVIKSARLVMTDALMEADWRDAGGASEPEPRSAQKGSRSERSQGGD